MAADIDDIPLTFGKHEGYSPNEIAESDPSYIVWLYEELDEPPCSEDLYEECLEDREDLVDKFGRC